MDMKTIMKQPIVWVAIGYDPDALLLPLHLCIFLSSLLAKWLLAPIPNILSLWHLPVRRGWAYGIL